MFVTGRKLNLPDGSVIQAGTLADAARACGVKPNTYTIYKRDLGAPGPVLVPDPVTGEPVPYRFPGTRSEAYDLNVVRAWNVRRPGSGYRPVAVDELRRTPLREAVLVDAEAGRLRLNPAGSLDTARLAAARGAGKRPAVTVTELLKAGALDGPDDSGRLRLSDQGVTLLARYRHDHKT